MTPPQGRKDFVEVVVSFALGSLLVPTLEDLYFVSTTSSKLHSQLLEALKSLLTYGYSRPHVTEVIPLSHGLALRPLAGQCVNAKRVLQQSRRGQTSQAT